MTRSLLTFLGFAGSFLLISCSSLKKVTYNDTSAAARNNRAAPHTAGGDPRFIDNIEVTPGGPVAGAPAPRPKARAARPEAVTAREKETAPAIKHIENADWQQLKYAAAMDATVEKLTNVQLLDKVEEWWGTKYALGGTSHDGIDCSAFTQTVMKDVYHVPLPRTAQEQYNVSEKIGLQDIREGDLVFFGSSDKNISHVGVYLANSKFANSSTSGGVTVSDLNDSYWKPRFRGAGRVR